MELSKIVEQILKITNESPYGSLDMNSSEAAEILKLLNKELKQGKSLPIDSVVNWLPFEKPNYKLFHELCDKKKCLCLYDDGTEIPFHHKNHPLAIMTHFAEI